ncbi:MAG: type II secretion system protein [Candidatus Omnitrophica bacterium]|nr:type II secretion system protein [Candidatus Omnitrophota bacterium]
MRSGKGFTLTELIIAIVVIGILATVAVPMFIDLTADATKKAEDYTVACIRESLELQRYDEAAQSL